LGKFDNLVEAGHKLVEFYRQHPCSAAHDLLGVKLAPIQRVVLRDIWFKNYTFLIATRGYGKCVHTKSISFIKNKGLVYLDEVFPTIPNYLSNGDSECVEWDDSIYTTNGFRNTKNLFFEKGVNGKKIVTNNRFVNKGSNQHPLLTLNSDGEFVYKRMDEFVVGDVVCIQRGQLVFGNNIVPYEDAYIMGLFIGDGSIKETYTPSITTDDINIINFCKDYCIKNNVEYRIDEDNRTKSTVSIYFKQFDWFFDKYNIDRCLSYYKKIPYIIRTSNKESQYAFLRGYFDADGTVEKRTGGVSVCSVSKNLLNEVQLMLLNFGIVSKVREKKTKSKFGKAYLLDIFSENALKFKELIGFGLYRKQVLLDNYFDNKVLNLNKDVIPYIKDICKHISDDYRRLNSSNKYDKYLPSLGFHYWNSKDVTYSKLHKFLCSINKCINNGYRFSNESINNILKLRDILHYNYYFDVVSNVEDWIGDCYDFEMDMESETEPNYFSNGFINHNTFILGLASTLQALLYPGQRVGLISATFRQSKKIFSEVEKLYSQSDIFKAAVSKGPVHGSDSHRIEFKNVNGHASYIEALPLGSGDKIRGSRFFFIVVDEIAQVDPMVLDRVIRPMAATARDPMERVERYARRQKLLDAGLITEDELSEDDSVNKLIYASSGYFKFNHMWGRMCYFWDKIEEAEENGKESKHAVWQIPYWELPYGFLDMDVVQESRNEMSDIEFRMEYCAEMVKDSEGFFKASLVESCVSEECDVVLKGDPMCEYILGVDPQQGGSDNCGIVVIKLQAGSNEVVNVKNLASKETKNIATSIKKFCRDFNIVRILMDKGGGGLNVSEWLAEDDEAGPPILTFDLDIHKNKKGKYLVNLINFSPSWISEANLSLLSFLESGKIVLPSMPKTNTVMVEQVYENVQELKSQLLNIVVTQNKHGTLHFDTPKKGQHKDLYSALLLACYGVKLIDMENGLDTNILYSSSGFVRPREEGAKWDLIDNTVSRGDKTALSMAVLKKKDK
jgi:hypothetical protein